MQAAPCKRHLAPTVPCKLPLERDTQKYLPAALGKCRTCKRDLVPRHYASGSCRGTRSRLHRPPPPSLNLATGNRSCGTLHTPQLILRPLIPATPCTRISCTSGILSPPRQLQLRQPAVGSKHLRQAADGRLHLRQLAVGNQQLRRHLRVPTDIRGDCICGDCTLHPMQSHGNLINEQRE